MKILALETSTKVGSVAISEDEHLIAEYTLNVISTHSERLLPSIDQILRDSKLSIREIDGFAISLGPGSFTGLRIGISTVKGLALAAEKGVVGVPTLDVLAHNLAFTNLLVCPLLDARKGEVYTALYRGNGKDMLRKLTPDLALKPDELLSMIKETAIFLGDGVEVYRNKLDNRENNHLFAPFYLNQPRASVLAKLGLEKFRQGHIFKEDEIQPLYCRLAEAEIAWKEKEGS
ncbi:MAG TPA: tRNA (adenosine(37)-N6)-threonylcarbamoyltransferase complex dimerization subunit type 1 TsaB [Thermodesulfobacteriota bacterium]|jgi:tRNA threonylcarbamoyladenosine biosynthesis protein TsaB|nr:tRNA (adenosine(37)-N6)-threonylcarbamoyltransferase complex dimerization subunit type 1 TsaB [Thermodesulfobacteriota bacterium]